MILCLWVRVTLRLAVYRQSFRLGVNPLRLTTSNSTFQLNTCRYNHCVTSSLTRGWVCFTIAAGPCQRSHSQVRVPRNSWSYFTVSDSRRLQPGGPGHRLYFLQKQGGPVIPPGTGFLFRRLLRLAGLRWRYSTPPQHAITLSFFWLCPIINPRHEPHGKHCLLLLMMRVYWSVT
jgi:hypothetical protein